MTGNPVTRSLIAIGAGIFIFTLSESSQAYIDPGTGSIILQSILASAAVTAGLLRMYWHRLKSLFGSSARSTRVTERDVKIDCRQDANTRNES